MGIDPTSINAGSWFATLITYTGQGRVELADGECVVEGPVTAKYDEFGGVVIEMQVVSIKPEINSIRLIGIGRNNCRKLTVITSLGKFVATESIEYVPHYHDLNDEHPRIVLTFLPQRPQFVVGDLNRAKYWVLPLTNFLASSRQVVPELSKHPLRLQAGNQPLITFSTKTGSGFIELLPDYNEREQQLLAHKERRLVTAVMVGEVGDELSTDVDLGRWFPETLLLLLGLTTGSEVSAPWLELRDIQGHLISRLHISFGLPIFQRRYKGAIDEAIHQGIGLFLSQAASTPDFDEMWLRSVLNNLVRCWEHPFIEDVLSHLFRALEALCDHFNYKTQYLQQELESTRQQPVKMILRNAREKIEQLAKDAAKNNEFDQARILRKISGRVSNSANIDVDFGLAVTQLLNHFNLYDADIIDELYKRHPRSDGRNWAEVLSHYRGAVMHQSHFDFITEHDQKDVFRVTRHLHDILVRLVFKLFGYTGTYQPTMKIYATQDSVSWVTKDLDATELGY
jgi:hypothetical protein